jgi:hypothetical protein
LVQGKQDVYRGFIEAKPEGDQGADGGMRLTLRKGWGIKGNTCLELLPFPFSTEYGFSRLRLHPFIANIRILLPLPLLPHLLKAYRPLPALVSFGPGAIGFKGVVVKIIFSST